MSERIVCGDAGDQMEKDDALDYVEQLAREIETQNGVSQNIAVLHAEWALRAIAATGCKVVGREPTETMMNAAIERTTEIETNFI